MMLTDETKLTIATMLEGHDKDRTTEQAKEQRHERDVQQAFAEAMTTIEPAVRELGGMLARFGFDVHYQLSGSHRPAFHLTTVIAGKGHGLTLVPSLNDATTLDVIHNGQVIAHLPLVPVIPQPLLEEAIVKWTIAALKPTTNDE